MKIFKQYILPIIMGSLAGMVSIWAFDSFATENGKFFLNAFLQSLLPVVVVVVMINQAQKNHLRR